MWPKFSTFQNPHCATGKSSLPSSSRDANPRLYTPADIEVIRKIHYLVKEKGLKIDAAQSEIRKNRDGIDKRYEVVTRLKEIRDQLKELQKAMDSIEA